MSDQLHSTIYNWLTAHGIPVEYKEGTGASYVLSISMEYEEEVKRLIKELAEQKKSMQVHDLDAGEGSLDHGEE